MELMDKFPEYPIPYLRWALVWALKPASSNLKHSSWFYEDDRYINIDDVGWLDIGMLCI